MSFERRTVGALAGASLGFGATHILTENVRPAVMGSLLGAAVGYEIESVMESPVNFDSKAMQIFIPITAGSLASLPFVLFSANANTPFFVGLGSSLVAWTMRDQLLGAMGWDVVISPATGADNLNENPTLIST